MLMLNGLKYNISCMYIHIHRYIKQQSQINHPLMMEAEVSLKRWNLPPNLSG
jgi:hypothetical protein